MANGNSNSWNASVCQDTRLPMSLLWGHHGTEQQLENHLLEWCGRMPRMGRLRRRRPATARTGIQRCHEMPKVRSRAESVELADHIKELHTAKRSAQPQKAHLSAAEDRKHYREILLLRAKQLDSTPTEGQPVAPKKVFEKWVQRTRSRAVFLRWVERELFTLLRLRAGQ